MSKAARFVLHINPLPRSDDRDGMRRLRAALKALLRAYSLRVVHIDFNTTNGHAPATGVRDDAEASAQ